MSVKIPDIHNDEDVLKFARETAKDFSCPKNFCGGRFQTHHKNIFIHVDNMGKLRKVEIDKEGGTKYFLHN